MYAKSGPDTLNPLAGVKMYEQRIGKQYKTYEYNGWKFFLLNSVRFGADRKYTGGIDTEQMEWIKHELSKTDSHTPVVIVTHIPLMTVEVTTPGQRHCTELQGRCYRECQAGSGAVQRP